MRIIIYPNSRKRTLASAGIFTAVGILALWRTRVATNSFQEVALWVVGFFGLTIGLVLFVNSFTRLIATSDGLEYRSTGFRIATPWENIESISTLPVDAFVHNPSIQAEKEKRDLPGKYQKSMEVLVLRQPVAYNRAWWMPSLSDEVRFVPMAEFSGWRDGNLGQMLKEHAPQVS